MGCLNDKGQFAHWFGNIHLSGPCNRSCYFCIGQHMMALDSQNNLAKIPDNLDRFLGLCWEKGVKEICLTGTNTDPLLYKRTRELTNYIKGKMDGTPLAIRTNGVAYNRMDFGCFDKASLTICSFNEEINVKMMGGKGCDLPRILEENPLMDIKVNVVLGPENAEKDVWHTLDCLAYHGVRRVNLREPYGQPHVGNPFAKIGRIREKTVLGMPAYFWGGLEATYWDVHYVEVESVNLYAQGRLSLTYPITQGHDPDGKVFPQYMFPGGRIHEQWL